MRRGEQTRTVEGMQESIIVLIILVSLHKPRMSVNNKDIYWFISQTGPKVYNAPINTSTCVSH